MITKIDDTRFEVDILNIFKELILENVENKILNYDGSQMASIQKHQYDILFLTPQNMASDFYKTDFFIETQLVDGMEMKGTQDIFGEIYNDITDTTQQIFFQFE